MTEQSTWDEFSGVDPWADVEEERSNPWDAEGTEEPSEDVDDPSPPSERRAALAAREGALRPCPWCLSPPDLMEESPTREGGVRCGVCNAVIPTEAEWYQEGETIGTPRWAHRVGYIDKARAMMEEL